MGRPSPLRTNRGPSSMGLPKIMPHFAVGSIQTGLRKRRPAPVGVLRRILPGGGPYRTARGLYDAARAGQSGFPQSSTTPDPRADPLATAGPGGALERRGESAPGGRCGDAASTAAGDRAPVRPFSAALLILLRGYKLLISPWLPSACRFYPTCSCYMHDAIAAHGAARGILLGTRRLLKCHPWHPGGIDRVPLQRTELHGR